jgi:hypothetical protein
MLLKAKAPVRSAFDVGPDDYVFVEGSWKKIVSNSACHGAQCAHWEVVTADGGRYDTWSVDRYAKAEDLMAEGP